MKIIVKNKGDWEQILFPDGGFINLFIRENLCPEDIEGDFVVSLQFSAMWLEDFSFSY